ncbi:MAG: carboxypeptidase regulatory-like domain-containing protein [Bryobacteraceae bacterium]|nr:carboxypeptidase-like regulatory domain-containing protein [Bryobacterales bacterium]MEB2360536.1 carboxypeptidase-like regulatory domain-containing protein [Bryobacterales bacterium]NUN02503.1 carboxypeptidase regulatory-like domain-containing protein [Bryobacteraceae bacterium]
MTLVGRTITATILVLLALCATAPAQTTFATITGTVTDASGAIVPDAKVTVRHIATGIESAAASNAEGMYTIPQLREGGYTVQTGKPGFRDFVIHDIELVGRDYRRADVVLQVGSVETVVEVTGGATLIETETARISDTPT